MQRIRAGLILVPVASLVTVAAGQTFVVRPDEWAFTVSAMLMVVSGALIAIRLPTNPVGRVVLLGGTAWLIYAIAGEYTRLSLQSADFEAPFLYLAAWLGSWLGALLPVSLATLVLIFPGGALAAGRRLGLAIHASLVLALVVGAYRLWGLPVQTLADFAALDRTPEYVLVDLGFVVGFLLVVPATISLILRFRRGSRVERLQMKWLLLVATLFGSVFVAGVLTGFDRATWEYGLALTLGLFPFTIVVAVVRYRLYDVDRIISRTVSYGILVGVLGAVFASGVVWIPSLMSLGDSSLAVAATTLVVAASFNPLRNRVQKAVDRRFNRSRYDAERVAEAFSGSLRDKVDSEGLTRDWMEIVSGTMEPAALSVWVRQ